MILALLWKNLSPLCGTTSQGACLVPRRESKRRSLAFTGGHEAEQQ